MTWFKIDDGFESHPKVKSIPRSKRLRAIGLWTLAGNWCARNLTDGHLGPHMVPELGGAKADATQLVAVRLWHTSGHECDACPQPQEQGGYVFHDWSDHQPTREHVERVREERRKAGQRGGKKSGQSRSKAEANCLDGASTLSNPRPVPSRPLSVVTTSSQSPTALDELTDEDWQKIQDATRGDRNHAQKVAEDVLTKAAGDVTSPRRYILRAVKNEPELYRYRRGNPTKAQECKTHPGEWADNCRACAIDARLGGSA